MTPPSNAGGEGREVLAREVLAEAFAAEGLTQSARSLRDNDSLCCNPWARAGLAAMRAFIARENADDRAPALVEAAVAEMRQALEEDRFGETALDRMVDFAEYGTMPAMRRDDLRIILSLARTALPTPSQEASNVG